MMRLDEDVILELLLREDFDRDIEARERMRDTRPSPPPQDARGARRALALGDQGPAARSWCWGGAGAQHRGGRRGA